MLPPVGRKRQELNQSSHTPGMEVVYLVLITDGDVVKTYFHSDFLFPADLRVQRYKIRHISCNLYRPNL